MPTSLPGRIFVSYRRQDSAPYAGRLRDRLAEHFGAESLFMDVDDLQAGVDFHEAIRAAVAASEVLLAVIGPGWSTATGRHGLRRLDDPADLVRVEVETALAQGIRVIPVLTEGASMPGHEELPEELAGLPGLHALSLRHETFGGDVARLVKAIEEALAAVASPAGTARSATDPAGGRRHGDEPAATPKPAGNLGGHAAASGLGTAARESAGRGTDGWQASKRSRVVADGQAPVHRLGERSWRELVDPDRAVVFRPNFQRAVWLLVLTVAGWIASWVAALVGNGGHWPSGPQYFENNFWLALANLLAVVSLGGTAGAGGWALCRFRIRSKDRLSSGGPWSGSGVWGEVFVVLLVFSPYIAVTAAVFDAFGLWSTVVGIQRHWNTSKPVAVAFVLVIAVLLPVMSAAAWLGRVWAIDSSVKSVSLAGKRRYGPQPRRPRLRRQRRFGAEKNPGDLLEAMLAIPSARLYTLTPRLTAVVAGRQVVLVSFASWPPGRYARRGSHGMTRDGAPFPAADEVIAPIVERLRTWAAAKLPARTALQAFVVVAVTGTVGERAEFDDGPGRLRFLESGEAVTTIGKFLARQPYRVDSEVAIRVWRLATAAPR